MAPRFDPLWAEVERLQTGTVAALPPWRDREVPPRARVHSPPLLEEALGRTGGIRGPHSVVSLPSSPHAHTPSEPDYS